MSGLRSWVRRLEIGQPDPADDGRPLYAMVFEQDSATGGRRVFGYFRGDRGCRELPTDYDLSSVYVSAYGPGMSWDDLQPAATKSTSGPRWHRQTLPRRQGCKNGTYECCHPNTNK